MAVKSQSIENQPRSIMRMPALLARIGLSESEVRRRIKSGTFPQPVKLGPRAIGFVVADVEAWLDSLMARGAA
ncbi:AlpA family phage regulatory protein [Burkholderia pseudomallei]|uniref:helix-turn-helix transcriptional regulator n=1 Tax=Burkholderia TaxID=32008 RepID=UPI0015DE1A28|nr:MULTISPECIES: AlpA family phage regulatory protein [Burkholderia]MEB5488111.1 AlpA family phage regulatory protein [Burkholderia pseudomallei]MEB5494613.1 AlpA family phage regulatory protein [Burkholderia pseudomallei]MEB5501135.1 AlpA family phage regulatory protein [Burkholderia pseudomallei]MEB5507005.1 AlpA family phage regulatory protein [Burkholderia pseudomallei]MEB5514045.1 AlpA family phage regulatory protein [Burkholderia pseudomallei]